MSSLLAPSHDETSEYYAQIWHRNLLLMVLAAQGFGTAEVKYVWDWNRGEGERVKLEALHLLSATTSIDEEIKIKEVLNISSDMHVDQFLEKLLEDYNYLATKE